MQLQSWPVALVRAAQRAALLTKLRRNEFQKRRAQRVLSKRRGTRN
jgi:hypothetical protein